MLLPLCVCVRLETYFQSLVSLFALNPVDFSVSRLAFGSWFLGVSKAGVCGWSSSVWSCLCSNVWLFRELERYRCRFAHFHRFSCLGAFSFFVFLRSCAWFCPWALGSPFDAQFFVVLFSFGLLCFICLLLLCGEEFVLACALVCGIANLAVGGASKT